MKNQQENQEEYQEVGINVALFEKGNTANKLVHGIANPNLTCQPATKPTRKIMVFSGIFILILAILFAGFAVSAPRSVSGGNAVSEGPNFANSTISKAAAIVKQWEDCFDPSSDVCDSAGWICCTAPADVNARKFTCRPGFDSAQCSTSTPSTLSTTVPIWGTCLNPTSDVCADSSYSCCVANAPTDIAANKYTCRPNNVAGQCKPTQVPLTQVPIWGTCLNPTSDVCADSSYSCCVANAPTDIAANKYTCRPNNVAGQCKPTQVPLTQVPVWGTCLNPTSDVCADSSYSCCVANSPADIAADKFTCRPKNVASQCKATNPNPGNTLSFKSINNPVWSTNGGWAGVKTLIAIGDSWTETFFNPSFPPTPSNPIGAYSVYNTYNYWGLSGSAGPNWVWGLTAQFNRSTILTWNFASAGAIIDSTLIRPFRDTVLDMKSQVSAIISTFRGASVSDRDSTLIAIMMGGNDVGNTYSPAASNVIPQGYPLSLLYPELVRIYFNQLGLLYAAGFRNFLLINAPPLGRSPNAVLQGSQPSYEAEIQNWNTLFQAGARTFTTGVCAGCTVYHYNVYSFLTYIMLPDVAATYNVTVVTSTYCEDYSRLLSQPYLNSPNCAAPVNQYFWLNTVHPTWGVMGQMAKDMVAFMS